MIAQPGLDYAYALELKHEQSLSRRLVDPASQRVQCQHEHKHEHERPGKPAGRACFRRCA